MQLISKHHKEIRALIRAKIENVKNVKVGQTPLTGGRTNKDTKLIIVADTFGIDTSTLRNWRKGYPNVGRQRLYALLYALDSEVLDILKEEFKDETK